MADSNKKSKDIPVIGYWKIRGLVASVLYVLEYLGVEHRIEYYEQDPDPARDKWLSVKHKLGMDFPNLPYLFHGDLKLTESQAIMRYVCNTWAPELLGKTPQDKAIADMVLGVLVDISRPVGQHCYGTGDREAASKYIMETMAKISSYLEKKSFVVGDYVTFVDFFLFECEEKYNWISNGELLKTYAPLAEHHKRMASLPKFGEYLKSDRFLSRPYNNPKAKINN